MRDCHLVAYRKAGLNPVAIASRSEASARETAQKHSIPKVYATYAQLLDDPFIEVLDIARGLGIEVTVRDETGYYEHRDEEKLLANVQEANRLIARIAGRLADAIDSSHAKTVAPLFEHPRFEHLEGAGS